MKHFRLVLLLGVALPTLLLAWGWYAASQDERQASRRAREAQMMRTADAVRGAVDESLEELRQRESRRPFYVYGYYYSPPEALALNDPVLVSPLAGAPEDPRLLGYFSVEPGGVVSTPHARPDEGAPAHAVRLLEELRGDELSALRESIDGSRDNVISESNLYAAKQAADLQSATAGDMLANARVLEQGRKNPVARAHVDAEPMTWRVWADRLVLQRVVHDRGGASVLQGAMLDQAHLLDVWLPRIVQRHADASVSLVRAGDATACAVRRSVSRSLPLAELCFAALPSERQTPWQLGALIGLMGIVFAGAYVVHRGSRRAEELAERKSRFVSAVTHELRTPLTTMRMHAEMLQEGLVSPTRQPTVHRELAEESLRLSRLIENVLELSRLERGEGTMQRRVVDVCSVVSGAAETQRGKLAEVGLELELELPEQHEAAIDAVAVERVVTNLLDNACKYARGSEPPVVQVCLERRGSKTVISVRDHGPGIPASARERVFERFERVADSDASGTGIGLSLVRDIARAHAGTAEVLPRDGGCTIIVSLG